MTGVPTIGATRPLTRLKVAPEALEEQGYAVLPRAVLPERVAGALRLLNLEIARSGIDPSQVPHLQQSTFFPHLRWNGEIWDLLPLAAESLIRQSPEDEWGEAQLLLRFPDEAASWPLSPHVDELPPWAAERSYRGVVGVALTAAGPEDGCLRVWPGSHRGQPADPVPVPLGPGDVVVMHPLLGHSGGLNQGSSIRMSVYFRLISCAEGARDA